MIPQTMLVICVILVAVLAGGAMAVRSASRIWLRHWAERRLHGAQPVQLYLERPQRLLAAANAAVALTVGLAGVWIGWHSRDDQNVAVLGLVGYAALVVFGGQLVPRALARRWPAAFIPIAMPVLRLAQIVAAPLLATGRRIAGVGDEDAAEPDTPHEAMQDLLREGELEGVGHTDEIAIISGVMEFGEKTVSEVMTPRQDIFAISDGSDARTVARQVAESAFSRIPVYRDSVDHIIGMYHAFDVLKEPDGEVPPLRPVAYASSDTPCNELLFRMLRARLHLAVVHDERGRTLGIATLENLLEELVGDIRDEHDEPAASLVAPAAASPASSAKT